MEQVQEASERFVIPTCARFLPALYAQLVIASSAALWILLGIPAAVLAGVAVLFITAIVHALVYVLDWHVSRRVFLVGRDALILTQEKRGWFGARPVRVEWSRVISVKRLPWSFLTVIRFTLPEKPGKVRRLWLSTYHTFLPAGLAQAIRKHVPDELVQLEALDPPRRYKLLSGLMGWGMTLNGLALAVVAWNYARGAVWTDALMALCIVGVFWPIALVVEDPSSWRGATVAGSIGTLWLPVMAAIGGVPIGVPYYLPAALAAAMTALLIVAGVTHLGGARGWSCRRMGCVYLLAVFAFGAVWYGDRGIPTKELTGQLDWDPWTPQGDAFALRVPPPRNAGPGATAHLNWHAPNGDIIRSVSLPGTDQMISAVGQEGALAYGLDEGTDGNRTLWYCPKAAGDPILAFKATVFHLFNRSPDGRWAVCRAGGKEDGNWLRVDMTSGRVEELGASQGAEAVGVHNDGTTYPLSDEERYSSRRSKPSALFSLTTRSGADTRTFATNLRNGRSRYLKAMSIAQNYFSSEAGLRGFLVVALDSNGYWDAGGRRFLANCIRYRCSFSDPGWWRCFELERWITMEAVLVDLDSPEANRLLGRE